MTPLEYEFGFGRIINKPIKKANRDGIMMHDRIYPSDQSKHASMEI